MAVGVNIVSDFDAKGIRKAISDFKKLEGAGNKATFGLRTFDSAVTNGVKNLAKFGAIAAAAAGVIGAKLADAAYESQKALAQTEAIIKATGGAANITGQQVSALSEKLSMQIGVDDELIQKSANLLLTFKQVQNQVGANNDIFNQAVTLSQDLGNVFGSADAAAMQLGKALSDPEKGITALRRAGINFTESQKEQIKTLVASGDVLGAQKLILAEVESQVGGTAAATATSFDIMRVAIGNVAERFGALLIPVIERFAKFVIESVVPYLNRLAEVMGEEGIGGGIRMLAGDFLTMTTNMGKFGNIMLVLIAAFTAFRLVAIAAAISQNLFNVALLANPIGIAVAAFIAIGVAVVAAYIKFEGFRKVVNAVINAIIGYLEFFVNTYIKGINLVISGINLLIKAANIFGAGLPQIAKIGEVSFGRIGNAANKASDKIFKTIDAIQAAKNAERQGNKPSTGSSSGDEDIIGGGGGGGGQSPIEKAKQALEKYIDAVKGLTSAQKSLREANKGVNQSNETLLEKTKALTEAQKRFNLVTQGYGADSKEAKDADKERTKAERAAERAKYALEQAVFAVSEAEKELAEIRKDPQATPKMLREAEIRLAESKLSVADATDQQVESSDALVESQNRLNEAVNGAKEGSDAYNEALKELADAEKDQRSAIDARTEAYERQAEAVEKLADAERDRIAAGKGVSKSDRAAVDASVPSVVAGVVAPVVAAVAAVVDVVKTVADVVAPIATTFATTASGQKFSNIAEQTAVSQGYITQDQADALFARRFSPFATGGIVTKPMMGLVGEAGAEAIIPLDRLGNMGSTYNISVTAGMGADGKDIGTQIVNALKRYERTNGALPLTVA